MLNLQPGIAIVTRPTRMEGLKQRWATLGAIRFALASAKRAEAELLAVGDVDEDELAAEIAADFDDLETEDDTYREAVSRLRQELDFDLPVQVVDRNFLPNFDFARFEVVVVAGQDGLVANTAKYVGNVPIVAVNPDPGRIDGVLLPWQLATARDAVSRVLNGRSQARDVTLAEVNLHDGQRLLAFNDLFVGSRSHVSARYRLELGEQSEVQSSSGLLVSTGAGSTGWMSSVFNMASGIAHWLGGETESRPVLAWEDRRLMWAVREPFASLTSRAGMVIGNLREGEQLVVESQMPGGGVIFSDGVEIDYLEFNKGTIARIEVSQRRARLVVA